MVKLLETAVPGTCGPTMFRSRLLVDKPFPAGRDTLPGWRTGTVHESIFGHS